MYRRKFGKLQGRMSEFGVKQKDFGPLLKKCDSHTYVSNRFTAKYPFTMDDVYAICDYLEIPYEEIPEYFPKGGIDPYQNQSKKHAAG